MKNRYLALSFNLGILVLFLLLTSACSGRSVDARGREELKFSKIDDTESSEKELFTEAVEAYDDQQYNNCSDKIDILLHNYPDGEFQEAARLKLIDSKFHSAKFSEVITLVDEYLELYPNATATPYLLTLAASSHVETFGGIGRDPTPLIEAKKYYEQIVKEYPDSDYYVSAEKALRKIDYALVSYQQYLVGYYQKQQLPNAAEARAKKEKDLKSKQKPLVNKRVIVPEGVPLSAVK